MHLAVGKGAGKLQKPVGKRAFAVVDVRDDAKIADVLHSRHLILVVKRAKVRIKWLQN
jgi:hypothetical protein